MSEMIPWFGGSMPVAPGTMVEVELRFGKIKISRAGEGYATRWTWGGPMEGHDDILAYRVCGERKTDISQFRAMLNYQPKVVVIS
jgi:hypothetical protein